MELFLEMNEDDANAKRDAEQAQLLQMPTPVLSAATTPAQPARPKRRSRYCLCLTAAAMCLGWLKTPSAALGAREGLKRAQYAEN